MRGSSLSLPVAVPGAPFSMGDGDAAQGDGEVCETAIECPMERVELTLLLHRDVRLKASRAFTEAGWLPFGFHRDLDEAAFRAVDAMLDLVG